MGTRGLFGFYYNGKLYLSYNHNDSYMDGLGEKLLNEIRKAIKNGTFNRWPERIKQLKMVQGFRASIKPTQEDINNLRQYTNRNINVQSDIDRYSLLRGCQESLTSILESGYILTSDTPRDTEYKYILNFDTNEFEVYFINSRGQESNPSPPSNNLRPWLWPLGACL